VSLDVTIALVKKNSSVKTSPALDLVVYQCGIFATVTLKDL